MQDRFKFRGLSKGKWYYGAYFKHLPYTPYCCGEKPPEKDYKHLIIQEGLSDWGLPRSMTCIEVEKDTVGQCTGLKDKNGKLIYEGDIVLGSWKTKLIVIYDVFSSRFMLKTIKGQASEIAYYTCFDTQGEDIYCKNLEILGNIYKNKDLLAKDGKND